MTENYNELQCTVLQILLRVSQYTETTISSTL